MHPAPLIGNESIRSEAAEMPGNQRLRQVQDGRQFTHAERSAQQQIKDPQPVRIPERFEYVV